MKHKKTGESPFFYAVNLAEPLILRLPVSRSVVERILIVGTTCEQSGSRFTLKEIACNQPPTRPAQYLSLGKFRPPLWELACKRWRSISALYPQANACV